MRELMIVATVTITLCGLVLLHARANAPLVSCALLERAGRGA